jgi:5'-nucleotidase
MREISAALLLAIALQAQAQPETPQASADVIFMQINDVYEIAPLRAGREGGMARVAAMKTVLKNECRNTMLVVAGDFLSPSAIGTSRRDGKRIAGAQMVDVMNRAGVDLVTFGNHEFDISETELMDRIDESRFAWVSANVKHKTSSGTAAFARRSGESPASFPEFKILTVPTASGGILRIGIIAVTLDKNPADYVAYENPYTAARRVCDELKGKVDYIAALTHLSMHQDRELAKRVPEIRLIMGGHEHRNMMIRAGETLIAKADANARTAWVHRLRVTGESGVELVSELQTIDDGVPEDSLTAAAANMWLSVAYKGFEEIGLQPTAPVTTLREALDGRESSMRYGPTNLGKVICRAMLAAAGRADAAIFNSGSVRIDDELKGPVSQYDIIRTLPFGGRIVVADMTGHLLSRVLTAGALNVGRGGYLQMENIRKGATTGDWAIGDSALSQNRTYRVALTDFLLSGKEGGLAFLTRDNPGISGIREPESLVPNDIRTAVVRYLQQKTR